MDIVTAFVTLLFVMDPLGNVPLFMSALKDVDPKRRQWIIARELLVALAILLDFSVLVGAAITVHRHRREVAARCGRASWMGEGRASALLPESFQLCRADAGT